MSFVIIPSQICCTAQEIEADKKLQHDQVAIPRNTISVSALQTLFNLGNFLILDLSEIASRVTFRPLYHLLQRNCELSILINRLLCQKRIFFHFQHQAAVKHFRTLANDESLSSREIAFQRLLSGNSSTAVGQLAKATPAIKLFWKIILLDEFGYEKIKIINREIDELCIKLIQTNCELFATLMLKDDIKLKRLDRLVEKLFERAWKKLEETIHEFFPDKIQFLPVKNYLKLRKRLFKTTLEGFLKRKILNNLLEKIQEKLDEIAAEQKKSLFNMVKIAEDSDLEDSSTNFIDDECSRFFSKFTECSIKLLNVPKTTIAEEQIIEFYSNPMFILSRALENLWDLHFLSTNPDKADRYFHNKFRREANAHWLNGI